MIALKNIMLIFLASLVERSKDLNRLCCYREKNEVINLRF